MSQNLGKASVRPEVPVYILNSGSIVGTKEGQGPLGLLFDMVGNDDMRPGKRRKAVCRKRRFNWLWRRPR